MRIALGSDERTGLTDSLVDDLRNRGHEVVLVGPPQGDELGWAEVGRRGLDCPEMLDAWFTTGPDPSEAQAIASLEELR